MTLSQLVVEDVEALYSGHSFLMADTAKGPLLDQDEEEALIPSSSLEGKAPASPPSPFTFYAPSMSPNQTTSSSPSFSASPSPSPPPNSLLLGAKTGVDSLSLSCLCDGDLLDVHIGLDNGKDDAFEDMDWMSEKIDLSELDLESLIGSCSSGKSPSSPEELLASLDSSVDLHLDSFDTCVPTLDDGLHLGLSLSRMHNPPPEFPFPGAAAAKKTEVTPHQKTVLNSEASSSASSPFPPSSAHTLDLESEAEETPLTATIIPDSSGSIQSSGPIVLSLPTTIVVMLTNEKPSLASLPDQSIRASTLSSESDSDSGIESIGSSTPLLSSPPLTPSPSAGSSRTKPYSKLEANAASSPSAKTCRVKSVSGALKVAAKKLKKMEQNKTAATRYRQKKRVEQEMLSTELEGLEKRNLELTEKAEAINREIQYLKDLMEEVRKHQKGKTSVAAQ